MSNKYPLIDGLAAGMLEYMEQNHDPRENVIIELIRHYKISRAKADALCDDYVNNRTSKYYAR